MNKLIIELITKNIQGQIAGKDLLPINIIGKPGIGKTVTCRAIAQKLGAGFINLSLPNTRLEQWSGIPDFVETPSMSQYSVSGAKAIKGTTWSAPEVIVTANRLAEKHGSCVILLDDFHELSSNKSVMAIMYEFLLERKLGDLKLHPGVALVAAMNDSEHAGFNGMSSAINDRLSMLTVEYDHDYWFNNYGKYLHHFISSFLKANPSFTLEGESTSTESAGSPRSWTYFSNSLSLYDEEFIVSNVKFLAKQFVSHDAAEAFAKHVIYMAAIDFSHTIKTQVQQKTKDLPFTDRMLWPYIISYVTEPADAAYIINLINLNTNDDMFIGHLLSELFIKYTISQNGQPITTAQTILIDKILEQYEPSKYHLSEKDKKELAKATITDQSKVFETASKFLL